MLYWHHGSQSKRDFAMVVTSAGTIGDRPWTGNRPSNPKNADDTSEPVNLKLFLSLCTRSDLTDNETCSLLGGITAPELDVFRNTHGNVRVDPYRSQRISYYLAIYKSLPRFLPQGLSIKDWLHQQCKDDFFNGKSPIQYLIETDLPGLRSFFSYVS
jgi:hypothetical protein